MIRTRSPVVSRPSRSSHSRPQRTLITFQPAPRKGLQLLDDLAVAPHGPVQPLQVAVDHEGEVVQRVVRGHLQQAARLRLVHLAVTEKRPDVLVGGVLDARSRR